MSKQSLDLSVKGTTIQSIFTDFVNEKFNVNRAYQRKLVWTQREKEYLLDSISKQLPIPLILLAKDQSGSYEIVDGLQRINAIIGFLRNEFALNGHYFDLERLGDTKKLRDEGQIKQQEPILDDAKCRMIYNYEVPVSVYTSSDDGEIEEVFRRINSSGRHLSRQDIRQAGALGMLPDIVREISSAIRGDITIQEIVPLSLMGQISISDGASNEPGIAVSDIFWVQNGILDPDSIRESKDEELVLDILLDVLLDKIVSTEAKNRDQAYGITRETQPARFVELVNQTIANRGRESVCQDFLTVFDELRALLDASGKSWRELTKPSTNSRVAGRYFQLMFVPFYNLMIKQHKVVSDRSGLLQKLASFWTNTKIDVPKGGGTLSIENKERIYEQVAASIGKFFSDGDPVTADQINARSRRFENDLMKSLTESSAFEIKLGLTDLDTRELNDNLLQKLPKIAAAIANTHPGGEGSIYIGVTEDTDVASRLTKAGHASKDVNVFHCVGIKPEREALNLRIEDYQAKISAAFKRASKEQGFGPSLGKVMVEAFDYHGLEIVSVRLPAITEPIAYKGEIYVRDGSHMVPVDRAHFFAFSEDFRKKIDAARNADTLNSLRKP